MSGNQSRMELILNTLYESAGYVKAEHLSNLTGRSTRTIRSDIKLLAQSGAQNGFVIESKTNCGYRLLLKDTVAFANFCGMPLENSKVSDKIFRSDKSLCYELLGFLLQTPQPIAQEDLQMQLFCSGTVLRNAMQQLSRTCRNAELCLHAAHNMVSITGAEYHKRLQLVYLLQGAHGKVPGIDPLPDALAALEQQITRLLLLNPEITISYSGVKLLAFYLCVARQRNEQDFVETLRVENFPGVCEAYPFQYRLARFLIDFLNDGAEKPLGDPDLQVLTLLLCVQSYPRRVDLVEIDAMCGERRAFMMDHLARVRRADFLRSDPWMNEQLGLFFYAEELRRKYRLYNLVYRPLLMKLKHTALMESAYRLYVQYCSKYQCRYSEREATFLANCLGNLELKTEFHDFHSVIGVASRYGMVESRRIAELLQLRSVPSREQFVPYELYELETTETHVDRIVTDCVEFASQKPVYYINSFAREAELEELTAFLNSPQNHDSGREAVEWKLMPALDAVEKEDVFHLVEKLYREKLHAAGSIYEELVRRDEKMPYEAGNRVAILCIQRPEISRNCVYFITLKKQIKWYLNDVCLAVAVFLKDEPESLRYLGGALTDALQRQDFVNELVKRPSELLLKQAFPG